MRHSAPAGLSAVLFFVGVVPIFAQSTSTVQQLPRITKQVDNAEVTALHSQVHPLLARSTDLGQVDGSLQLDRLTLMLKRSDAQEQALQTLLVEQQTVGSPNYHRWLTPQKFGERFGVALEDIQQVTNWLESEGFKIDRVANGRGFIEFSGNAAQVARAFHTSIHHYSVNGEAHIANSTTLAIPAALAPVVESLQSLNDFRKQPLHIYVPGRGTGTNGDGDSHPAITFDQNNQSHGLAPSDYAAIYNIQTLYNQGVTGAGKTIAVVGRSNINPATLANFRSIFGLGPGNNSTVVNGTDPGVLDQIGVPCTTQSDCPERDEALLDNEWSSAIAPGAAVKFVVSQTTATADGVDLSEMYIIDNNLADVMTESFGACEASVQQSDANAIATLASQAAAQGITYMVSTGDNGSAGCADPTSASATGANATPSVNILASSPYTIAVGGTQFNEACTIGADGQTLICSNYTQYWSAMNAASNSVTPFLSALGYIPENVWNESCPTTTTGSVTGCGPPNSATGGGANLFASSGGASQFFAKPPWQQLAIMGIPAANHRYLPDVSLTAAGHDFYVVCLQDTDCVPSNGSFSISGISGTSASAPAFAGIMALVNQKVGTRQGDAHNTLYSLAATENFAQCNGSGQSGAPAANCIFNDTTVGNNAVPGEAGYGTPSATYQAGVGYDQATGLGSVNAANLVNKWTSVVGTTATTTTLTVAPTTSTLGQSVTLTATVTGTGGTPTGNVTFTNSSSGTIGTATLSGGVATLVTTSLPPGTYTISAQYGGDSTFATSTSVAVNVTVNKGATATTLTIVPGTSMRGMSVVLTATLAGTTAITPTGTVTFVNSNNVTLGTVTLSAGVAQLVTATLPIGAYTVTAQYAGDTNYSPSSSTAVGVTISTPPGLQFIPVAPCRIADTRNPVGAFGGPAITAGTSRDFNIPMSACGISAAAQAYSLNVTVVPNATLGYLAVWPSGAAQPFVSTLNSDGRIKANAAIVPAGANGAISVFSTDTTNVILDINGYFVPAGTASALSFYPLTPCRVADTRLSAGSLGGPFLSAGQGRAFPIQSSSCNIPANAQAYSLNFTVVPHQPLGYLATWPTGQTQPFVSTLNAPTAQVTANAAIVPAGNLGSISVFATNDTDVILDVNGYFAPPAAGGLSLYTITPCRALDTRNTLPSPFSGTISVNIETGPCGAPPSVQGYVLNATVVPSGAPLFYLTLWPDGQVQPFVSTLNANDGTVTPNMAIVPTTNGSIDAFAANPTHLILDLSGYFAP